MTYDTYKKPNTPACDPSLGYPHIVFLVYMILWYENTAVQFDILCGAVMCGGDSRQFCILFVIVFHYKKTQLVFLFFKLFLCYIVSIKV